MRATTILSTLCVLLTVGGVDPALAVPLRGPVTVDSDGQHAAIACRKDNSLAIVDLTQGPPYTVTHLDARDGIGRRPIAARIVGSRVLVVNEYDTKLTVVDLASASVTRQVEVPLYSQDVLWDAARGRFYVSNRWIERVLLFDADWNPVDPIAGIPTGGLPGPMTIGNDGKLYVANRGSWDVSVIDLDAKLDLTTVPLGSRPEGLAALDDKILVTNHGGAILQRLNGTPLIEDDQTDIINVLTEIDTTTLGTVDRFLDQGGDYAGVDVGAGLIAFSGAGTGTVHVHRIADPPDSLQTVDLLSGGMLPGGQAPSGLRIFTNTRDVAVVAADRILAVNHLRDTMVELREQGGLFEIFGETALNPAGVPITGFQPPPAVNFNNEQNGERYLNTVAAWKRGQRDFTCATCHTDGHSDLRIFPDDAEDPFAPGHVQGPERHPSLRETARTAPYGWEGDQSTLFEFNIGALDKHDLPPSNPADPDVFIDVAEFMAFFAETLRPGPNPYRRDTDRGRILFEGAGGCVACHALPEFTDNGFWNVGTGRVINTPSLIGLWDRETYLHDGRAATIDDVLDPAIYDPGFAHGNLGDLSPIERSDLAQYLRSIGPDTCVELVGPDPDTDLRVSKGPCRAHLVQDPPVDYVRATLAGLQEIQDEILLSDAACMHNDRYARNLEVTADDTTARTGLWLFLVRPSNGDASYGLSSSGKPRFALQQDCSTVGPD